MNKTISGETNNNSDKHESTQVINYSPDFLADTSIAKEPIIEQPEIATSTKSSNKLRIPRLNPSGNRRRFGAIGVALVSGAATTNFYLAHEWGDENSQLDCSDPTNEYLIVQGEDNAVDLSTGVLDQFGAINGLRDLDGIAEYLSNERGYVITAQGIAEANQNASFITFGEDGLLKQPMNEGANCIELPPPVISGYALTDSDDTLDTIARTNLTTPQQLRDWNPELAGMENDVVLTEGLTIRVNEELNTQFVVQEAETDLATVSDGDPELLQNLLIANAADLASGESVNKGDLAYLPYTGSDDSQFTPEEIIDAYWPDQTTD